MTTSTNTPVKSVETAIRLVEALDELEGAGVTELANEVEIAKSTVHDHLQTLEAKGFVVKVDREYHVGLRFLDHGGRARMRRKVYRIGKPELRKLADNTGELANLVVEEHGLGVYIDVARGANAVNLDTYIGKREFLHSTAVGKAILAHLSSDHIDSIIDTHGLPAETEQTTTTRDELITELKTIRERGFATDKEERLSGLRCVAAAIVTDEGDILGGVSVSGPASRMQDERLEDDLATEVMRVANVIEVNTTYS